MAFGGLHGLPDQRVEGLFLAGTELLDRLLVGGEDPIHQRFDGADIGDLLQALLLDDLIGRTTLAVPEGLENLLRDVVRDRVVGDARDQAGELRRVERGIGDFELLAVEARSQFAHDPVGDQLGAGGAGLANRDAEEISHGARAREDRRIIGGQAVLGLQALLHGLRQLG